jgi:SAM-dependent methyltransferase
MLDAAYWEERYAKNDFPWDIGYSNPILTRYVEQKVAKDAKILVPGAGSAYEVEVLWNKGYTKVKALDYATDAKERFLERVPTFPHQNYLLGNFFELTDTFDIVLEQTFFCALDPKLRMNYVEQMHRILRDEGVLFGLLFEMEKPDGPPFGGNSAEYQAIFGKYFEMRTLEKCLESIPPRLGSELVIEFIKK